MIVAIIITSIVVIKWNMAFDIPKSTGGYVSSPDPRDATIGSEINNLIKSLPLKGEDFEITIYDYRHAKFLVNTSNKESFIKWHESSEFKNIPQSMFDIK